MQLREAGIQDKQQILNLAERVCQDMVLGQKYKWSPQRFGTFLDAALTTPSFINVYADHDGNCVGYLCSMLAPHYYFPVTYAANLTWNVDPNFQGHGIGTGLLNMYVTLAKKQGADVVLIGNDSGANERIHNLILRQKFEQIGAQYLYKG